MVALEELVPKVCELQHKTMCAQTVTFAHSGRIFMPCLNHASFFQRDINRPEEYFLKKRVTPVTLNPPNLQGFLGFLGRELQQRSGRVNTGPSSRSPVGEGPVPRLRSESNFQTTPLFKTFQTSTDGKGEVQFTAPDNLGTFVVRAYATTGIYL